MKKSKTFRKILSVIASCTCCVGYQNTNAMLAGIGQAVEGVKETNKLFENVKNSAKAIEEVSKAVGKGFFSGMGEGINTMKLNKDFLGDPIRGVGPAINESIKSVDTEEYSRMAGKIGEANQNAAEKTFSGVVRGLLSFPAWAKFCVFLLSSSPITGNIIRGYIDLLKIDISQAKYERQAKELFSGSNINYSVPWKQVHKKLESYMKKAYSNKPQMETVIDWIRSFYIKQQEIDSGKRVRQLGDSACLLISIDGGPGCGKTQFCRKVAEALGCTRINSIGPGDFDPDHKTLSLRQQAVGSYNQKVGELSILNYGKLVNILKNNRKGVLLVDDLGSLPSDIRRVLWDMRDYGYVVLNGEVVDCTGTIVLLTSNEGINNVDLSNKLSVASAEATRMKKITFYAPKYEDFLSKIGDDLKSIKSKNKKKIDITYDDILVQKLASFCVQENKAWRGWGDVREQIEGLISNSISTKNRKLDLNYDKIFGAVTGTANTSNVETELRNKINRNQNKDKDKDKDKDKSKGKLEIDL